MELKSMTDFVLEQREIWNNDNINVQCSAVYIRNTSNYANFLKQPLTLSMFVPCGDDGQVYNEPKAEDYFNVNVKIDQLTDEDKSGLDKFYSDTMFYEDYKERCLFEGFEVKSTHNLDTEKPCYVVTNGENEVTFHIGLYNFSKGVEFAKTIEDLVPINPTLTQSAITQITTRR